ncbi:hypothetical protein EYF80_059062 [Liparis tanakae]|uniref:Uncharacterized protein n=1 Tax=Liparis tanakae TaxID=230148 RepID=A0A4Z2EPR7_9TELE|nr:hypothetical protein EYF80_059062 [Liparis tanakae]
MPSTAERLVSSASVAASHSVSPFSSLRSFLDSFRLFSSSTPCTTSANKPQQKLSTGSDHPPSHLSATIPHHALVQLRLHHVLLHAADTQHPRLALDPSQQALAFGQPDIVVGRLLEEPELRQHDPPNQTSVHWSDDAVVQLSLDLDASPNTAVALTSSVDNAPSTLLILFSQGHMCPGTTGNPSAKKDASTCSEVLALQLMLCLEWVCLGPDGAGRGGYLSLLGDLLGVDVVVQVRAEVAVGVGQRVLDLPQGLVVVLGPLDALLQLLLPERRLGEMKTSHMKHRLLYNRRSRPLVVRR